MKRLVLAFLLAAVPLGASTNNDDTCDVGLFPAATLLLPYFEVSLDSTAGESTIFTVTNTGAQPQAARVTLWTDFAYPVLSFDLYLTGYDVQKVSLFDVIARGMIGPDASPAGKLSEDDNPRLDEASCANLPRLLPAVYVQRMQSAFRTGRLPEIGAIPACNTAGGLHQNAVGYATIDVVGSCTGSTPFDESYFTHEIRFDNVLIGDYVQINGGQNFAQASPMVHIRAIPEGGQVSTRKKTHLPRTFYGRLQPAVNAGLDARQPLPAVFGARWIDGGSAGFETLYKIWRESASASSTACRDFTVNAQMQLDAVRFDEAENPEAHYRCPTCNPRFPIFEEPALPSTALVNIANESIFPVNSQDAFAGWLYLNLDNASSADFASQNWITTSMRAENRFSVDIDATAFRNGCSPPTPGTLK